MNAAPRPTAPPDAGATTASVKPMRPRACSRPSHPVATIRVGSDPIAPPIAGARTATAKRMRPQVRSLLSQPAGTIRVGSKPTAPSDVGTGLPVSRVFPRGLSRRRHPCAAFTGRLARPSRATPCGIGTCSCRHVPQRVIVSHNQQVQAYIWL